MKITSIRQQAKRADRYSIYVDEKYSFSLSESALLASGLSSGKEVTPEQISEYKRLSADDKLYNRALRYVALRPRSEWEMRTYLERKDASPALIGEVVEKLTDLGLLDDMAFAASFVRDRQLLRPTSRRRLVLELKKKRIAEDAIRQALEADDVQDKDSLSEVIAKKRRQTKYQDDQKLMQYLARQGYGYSDIKSALSVESED